MVLSDLVFLRRSLSAGDMATYVGLIASGAAVIGLMVPGYLVMVGVPVTAFAILVIGFVYRSKGPMILRHP